MLTRIISAVFLALMMWCVVGVFDKYLGNEATVIAAMIICTSIITYKIDQLRKEIKKDKDPEKSEKTEE